MEVRPARRIPSSGLQHSTHAMREPHDTRHNGFCVFDRFRVVSRKGRVMTDDEVRCRIPAVPFLPNLRAPNTRTTILDLSIRRVSYAVCADCTNLENIEYYDMLKQHQPDLPGRAPLKIPNICLTPPNGSTRRSTASALPQHISYDRYTATRYARIKY